MSECYEGFAEMSQRLIDQQAIQNKGATRYMGARLCDNYTSTPCEEDFGSYASYAGPVCQTTGYRGYLYAYMEAANGSIQTDAKRSSTPCNCHRHGARSTAERVAQAVAARSVRAPVP